MQQSIFDLCSGMICYRGRPLSFLKFDSKNVQNNLNKLAFTLNCFVATFNINPERVFLEGNKYQIDKDKITLYMFIHIIDSTKHFKCFH